MAGRKMDASYSEPLNFSELHYAGFRAAFLTTLDCLLRDGLAEHDRQQDRIPKNRDAGSNPDPRADVAEERYSGCGFLDRIPLLSSTAPQIQLECLFQVWHRWNAPAPQFPTVVDQCVIYAAMEWLALLSLHDNQRLLQMIWRGPRAISTARDCWLYSKIRALDVCMPTTAESHSKAVARRLEKSPQLHETCLFSHSRIVPDDHDFEKLLQIVGRWRIRREALGDLGGLVTLDEQAVLMEFLEQHPGLFE